MLYLERRNYMEKRFDNQPNILLIMTDQQRSDSLGCYGADWVETPNLDTIAADGVVFENCYVTNTICTPSRASMWTGKHLPGHGVYKLYDNLPQDQVLFSELLQEAGYTTGLFGKLHVSGRLFEANNRHPHDGFDEYEWCMEASIHLDSPYNGYAKWLETNHPDFFGQLKSKGRELLHHSKEVHFTHWAAERSIDFIHRHAGKTPFFCCMSVFDPHNPYNDYPEEMRSRVDMDKIPKNVTDDREDAPDGVLQEREHSYLGKFSDFSGADVKQMRLGYYASIALIDEEVGRVLSALEEKGVTDNTIVIFVSDHGDMLGDHGILVKGAFFYDAGVKVPLIIRWPARIGAGKRIKALVQPHDLSATILNAAGVIKAGNECTTRYHDGRSLLPLTAGDVDKIREHAVCAYRNSGISDKKRPWDPPIHCTMIRDKRYKLSLYHTDPDGRGELYDMVNDPNELHNLFYSAEYAAVRQELTDSLLQWTVNQELKELGSRGGEQLPGKKDQIDNMINCKGAPHDEK